MSAKLAHPGQAVRKSGEVWPARWSLPLFHRTLQDSNNFLRGSTRHVHIKNAGITRNITNTLRRLRNLSKKRGFGVKACTYL